MQRTKTTFETLVNDLMAKGITETMCAVQEQRNWSDAQTLAQLALTTSVVLGIPELQDVAEGKKLQVLTDLVGEAKYSCSKVYQRLRQESSDATREELNRDECLLISNAVRKNLQGERRRIANALQRRSAARSATL